MDRDAVFVEAVRNWWGANDRDLPWRSIREPWPILVSEVMAQQTQVDRVIPRWFQFLERFPTPRSVADSTAGDVVALWDGLGYNRRAILLHRCAVVIVERHAGTIPDDLGALLALPGVGPYTARAVLAFSFEHDVAVVDTNVGRVLARVAGRGFRPAEVQARAEALLPEGKGWAWNQAMLDFGAVVCTKRSPGCASCPARPVCGWAGVGPDPAVGSAAVSAAQSRFEGSDRQGRGRLVSALRTGPVSRVNAADVMAWDHDRPRAERVIAGLIRDGLVIEDGLGLRLP